MNTLLRKLFYYPTLLCLLLIGQSASAQRNIINVTSATTYGPGAVADAVWGLTGCKFVAANQVKCPFPQSALGTASKYRAATPSHDTIIVDTFGGPETGSIPLAPLVTTVTGISYNLAANTQTITLSGSTSATTLYNYVTALKVITGSGGSGYSFASQQKLTCTACASLSGGPSVMTVVSAATGLGGSGGINGSCLVTLSTQTAYAGAPTQVSVNIAGHAIASISSTNPIPRAGLITGDGGNYTGGTGTYLDLVSGCGLSGAKLVVSYSVVAETVVPNTNAFGTLAPTPVCTSSSGSATTPVSGGGSGLYLQCSISFATVSYGWDNTTPFVNALKVMNASPGVVNPQCIYVPAGNYLTTPVHQASGVTNAANGYGCWLGDEHYNSNIFIIPNTVGDVFAWYDAGINNSLQPFGGTISFNDPTQTNMAGASFRNISIFGNRASNAPQNGLAFYGATQYAYIDNIVVDYMNGSAIVAGLGDTGSTGTFDESHIASSTFEYDGDSLSGNPGTPAVLLTSTGSAEATNNVNLTDLQFFDEWGPGLVIESDPTNAVLARHFLLSNVTFDQGGMSQQFEYSNSGVVTDTVPVIGDEFRLGNYYVSGVTAATGVINVLCKGVQFSNPVSGYAALHVGPGSYDVACDGEIDATSADGGHGVQADNCGGTKPDVGPCKFEMAGNSAIDYGLVIGMYSPPTDSAISSCSGPSSAQPIVYSGGGYESFLAVCVDPAVSGALEYPVRQVAEPQNLLNAPFVPLGSLASSFTNSTGCNVSAPCVLSVTGSGSIAISAQLPLWIITRSYSSPPGPIVDSWDSAINIMAVLNTGFSTTPLQNGSVFYARICNQTSVNEAVEPNSSGETGLAVSIAPDSCANFTLTITSVTAPTILISGA